MHKYKIGDILRHSNNHFTMYEVILTYPGKHGPVYNLKSQQTGNVLTDMVASVVEDFLVLDEHYMKTKLWKEQLEEIINS